MMTFELALSFSCPAVATYESDGPCCARVHRLDQLSRK